MKKNICRWLYTQHILEAVCESLSQHLNISFNESLKQSCLPKDWLCHKVVTMHKPGNTLLSFNYWPISFTRTCCEILEYTGASHITQFLETNNILVSVQHGFMKQNINNDSVNSRAN